jgi:hypothetical protein
MLIPHSAARSVLATGRLTFLAIALRCARADWPNAFRETCPGQISSRLSIFHNSRILSIAFCFALSPASTRSFEGVRPFKYLSSDGYSRSEIM